MGKSSNGEKEEKEEKKPSRSQKAGLIFPISRLNRHLRDAGRTKRIGAGAPVYLAAVLEYVANEIVEAAGNDLGKRKRITPSDLLTGIRSDEELNKLIAGAAVYSTDRIKGVASSVTFVAKK